MSDYPEHDKLTAISDKSQEIGRFLDEFLPSKGWELAYVPPWYDHTLIPVRTGIVDILAEFYGIDQDKIEAEKRAMLAAMRGEPCPTPTH